MRVALNNWFRILALLACLVAVPALAQEDAKKALDFDEWARTAERAERIIENAEASSTALEALRTTLSEFRTKALEKLGKEVKGLRSKLSNEAFLAKGMFTSHIHQKKPPRRPMPERIARANATRSAVRQRRAQALASGAGGPAPSRRAASASSRATGSARTIS